MNKSLSLQKYLLAAWFMVVTDPGSRIGTLTFWLFEADRSYAEDTP
jgi:hypothetical protein